MSSFRQFLENMDNSAFKAWFGASKVVDPSGKPLVVYKGLYTRDWRTKEIIQKIQRQEPFPSFDPKDQEPVHLAGFFSSSREVANNFSMNSKQYSAVFPAYLSIQNPFIIDAAKAKSGTVQFGAEGKVFRDAIRSGRYDGVIIKDTDDEADVYIPLQPNQIKSTLGNSGNYSSSHNFDD